MIYRIVLKNLRIEASLRFLILEDKISELFLSSIQVCFEISQLFLLTLNFLFTLFEGFVHTLM